MTNTRITDAEVFERRYPVILREFSIREGSGGEGLHRGGDGVVRDIEFTIPMQVSILSERRVFHPYGLEGGEDAACGENYWVRRESENGQEGEKWKIISLGGKSQFVLLWYLQEIADVTVGKNTTLMKPGEHIIVKTPGGGGWGKATPDQVREKKKRAYDAKHAWRGGSITTRLNMQETN